MFSPFVTSRIRRFTFAIAAAALLTGVGLVAQQHVRVNGQTITTFPSQFTTSTVTRDAIATTSTDGFIAQNTTAATGAVTQQISPRIKLCGAAWNSSSAMSETDCWLIEAAPNPQAGTTQPFLRFARSTNGGAFASGALGTPAQGEMQLNLNGSVLSGGSVQIAASSSLIWVGTLQAQSPTNGELDIKNNAATIQAGLRFRGIAEANTTTKTPSAIESGEFYVNTGDADGSTLTLLDDPPAAGLTYSVVVTANATITIAKNTGETLMFGASTCGTSLTSTTVGSTVTIMCAISGSGGLWVTTAFTGTWTCNA